MHLDVDVEGYRPTVGESDRHGQIIEDREYNQRDFDRTLVIDERTGSVARKITQFLQESGNPMQKTIVFCVDTEHAARMRQALINENQERFQQNERYIMRITGDDAEGAAQLSNFIDPEAPYPVIVTTSRLLSTGVDAQTCRLIVLDRAVGSMTEFKQIVGRGTRVHEESKKYYFTILDFRKATSHFADKNFDGDPVQIYEPAAGDPLDPPDAPPVSDADDPLAPQPSAEETIVDDPKPDMTIKTIGEAPAKYYIRGKPVAIVAERIEYLDAQGRLVTESLRDYSKRAIQSRFTSLDAFLQRWQGEARKQAVIDELAEEGLLLFPLLEEVGRDLDPFDLICYVAYDQPPLTRRQRVAKWQRRGGLQQTVFTQYGDQARAVLTALLQKYQDEGVVTSLDDPKILRLAPFSTMGTPLQLVNSFGGRPGFETAVHELQRALYEQAA